MLTDCPDPQEVADFHFRQLRTLKIAENGKVPSQSVNLLASGSKHGLLFVGMEGGFKVIKLEDILSIDEDKENRSIADNYSCPFVPCGTPLVLSVNANQTTLAVCVRQPSGIILQWYAIASFSASGGGRVVSTCGLSSANLDVTDFLWNPTVEGLFACCLSDGSLHIYEVNGTSIKSVASLPSANALSVCWSPKGKQLVCGKLDGSFTQYKQSLQEVKTVPPPRLDADSVSVSSICWMANTVFAVVYVASDSPNLFLVSTPKDSAVVYTNFGDVCLGNNNETKQKYFFHLEPLWGIFICASIDSIEIAVLGNMPNWVQWDLREDGKALLPGKDGATHAVGLAVMYSAQRQIQISESEMYPPMPVMFLLTNNGLLISFHMINAKEGAANLVSPPLPLQSGPLTSDDPQMSAKPVSLTTDKFHLPSVTGNSSVANPIQSTPPQSSISGTNNSTFSLGESFNGNKTFVENFNKQLQASTNDVRGTKSGSYLPHPEEPTEPLSSMETSYRLAILSEIQSFEKELQALKLLQNFDCDIDKGEDMVSLKIGALNLQNFQKDIFETMQSLSSDIYSLKNVLLECFVMVEEASSRERRRNDHSYITILKERSLDPLTAKRMQKVVQHQQYLSIQLQELNNRLDEDWIQLLSSRDHALKNTLCISSTEAVYKTIVNNQKIIHSLKKKVDVLLEKNKEKKLRNTTKSGTWRKYERSTYEDLSKLADEFLNVKVSHPGEKEEAAFTKKLCPESQNSLKAFLKESHVVTVRPTVVYSSSQSRLLSSAIPSQDLKKQETSSKSSANTAPLNRDYKATHGDGNVSSESVQTKYAPLCEPVTPPEDKQSPKKNLFGGTSNETGLGSPFASVPPVSIHSTITQKICTGQEFNFGIIPSSDKEVHRAPLFPSETNTPDPCVASTAPQSSSSFFPPNAISLTHPKSQESTFTVSSASLKNTNLFSLAHTEKKDTLSCSAATTSPSAMAAFVTDTSHSFQQGLPSTAVATVSFSTGSSFTPSAVMAPQTSNSLFNVPTSKNSAHVSFFEPNAPKSFSFFQKGATEQANIPEKDQTPSATEASSLVNLLNSNVSSLKLFSQQESQIDEPISPISKAVDSIPPMSSSQCSNALVVTSNQPSINNASELKQVASTFSKFLSEPVSVENTASEGNTVSNSKTCTAVAANSPLSNTLSQNMTSVVTLSSVPPTLVAVSSILSSTTVNSTASVITVSSVPSLVAVSSAPSLVAVSSAPSLVAVSSAPSLVAVSSAPSLVAVSSASSLVAVSSAPSVVAVSPVTSTAVVINADASSTMTASNAPSDQTNTSVTVIPALSSASTVTLAGEKVTICSPVTSDSVKNTNASSGFAVTSPLFNKTTSGTSFFQTTTTTTAPVFGQSQSSSFGQPSNFSSSSTFFGTQPSSFEAPTTTSAPTASSSDIDSALSSFSFGKTSNFGQTTSGFGLSKSLFGQNEASSNPTSGTTSALTGFSFAQNPTFGQGSFFSGLGGKPSEENASKNVFGSIAKSTDSTPSNLFGNSGVTSFGAVNNNNDNSFGGSGGGSFIAGGGSVAQSGFGAFQKSPIQQQTGGFGTAPAFGGAPAFGSAPAFGASPSFGSGSPLGSVFGQQQQVASNFSNFANASSPTFGSLASQGSTFGSPSGGGGGTTFGSQGFGGMASFASPTSSFGNPGSPASSSSAFTQWRN